MFIDGNSIFQHYSKPGCIFECSMNFAIKRVGCLPWDFPVPLAWENTNLDVCHSANLDANLTSNKLDMFYAAMNDDSNLRTYQCMPDCETTVYDTQVGTCMYK